jgi:hypothetical protein
MALGLLHSSLLQTSSDLSFARHQFLSFLTYAAIFCVFWRLWTGFRYARAQTQEGPPKEPGMLPHWIPYLGHGLSYVLDYAKLIRQAR